MSKMEEVSAFKFYHGAKPEIKKKKKQKDLKKKLYTPDERSVIQNDLKLMKSVSLASKKEKVPPTNGANGTPDPKSSKKAEKKKRQLENKIKEVGDGTANSKTAKEQIQNGAKKVETADPKMAKKSEKRKRQLENGAGKAEEENSPKKVKTNNQVGDIPSKNVSKKEKKLAKKSKNASPQVAYVTETRKSKAREPESANGKQTAKKAKLSDDRSDESDDRSDESDDDSESEVPILAEMLKPESSPGTQSETDGSFKDGQSCFEWMINPCKADSFFDDTFEKRPLHIKRGQPNYFKDIFSTKDFDNILKNKVVLFGKNLDVTSYTNGVRETHNPEGRAYGPVVWDYYNSECSLRFLNPQTFHDPIWKLCATLQDFLGSMVGCNMYLTPPGTQGFAPHYDDVDVYILQLEGKKHWRLYEPRNIREKLPRFSSPNFSQDEIGEPCKDFILEAGDMVYLPRGTIHQGDCLEGFHSLHITISCQQLTTFGDLLKKMLPAAIESAMEEDIDFREGLPNDYLRYMGAANTDSSTKRREAFTSKVKNLFDKLFTYSCVDSAVDQMGKQFMHDILPPYLTEHERARCVEAGGETWDEKNSTVVNIVELDPDTEIRLIRGHILRLVSEENVIRLYHCVDNTREYHEADQQFLEIEPENAELVETLINSYPNYVTLESLAGNNMLEIVQSLWENKLIMTKEPLLSTDD